MTGRALGIAGAVAVAVAAWALVRDHVGQDSLSADEPVHILAGYFEISGRTAIVNIEHPPLAKALAGIALTTLPLPPAPPRVPLGNRFTTFGHAFLFEGPVPPDAIAGRARAPFGFLLALLVLLLFAAARRRYGTGPALFAAALVGLDPNFVAHAGVVHTDLAAALAFLATVLAWDRVAARPTAGRLLIAALALGAALATKFSAVYLVPILLLQSLLAARRDTSPARAAAVAIGRLAGVAAAALLVVVGIYAVVTSRMDRADQRQVIWEMVGERGAPRLARSLQSVAAVSPPLGHYLGGLAAVARQNAVGGGVNYLNGRISENGFPEYFFVAFFAKSTLGFLAATALAIAGAAAFRLRDDARLALVPPAVMFLASIGSSYNIGIRHLLPAYPFLALGAAAVLARLSRAGRGARAGALVLLVALPAGAAAETLGAHPHELSYFNPLVGGPEGGRRLLSDSNVDWGLDLERLAAELERRGIHDPTVAYFGGDDVSYRVGVPDFSAEPRVRGRVVAVSAFLLAAGPAYYAYHGASEVGDALARLLAEIAARGRPIGRIGHSMYLFELPAGEAPRS